MDIGLTLQDMENVKRDVVEQCARAVELWRDRLPAGVTNVERFTFDQQRKTATVLAELIRSDS